MVFLFLSLLQVRKILQFNYTHNSTMNTNNVVTLKLNNRLLIHSNIKPNKAKLKINIQLVQMRQ